jgi:hypothetical protein
MGNAESSQAEGGAWAELGCCQNRKSPVTVVLNTFLFASDSRLSDADMELPSLKRQTTPKDRLISVCGVFAQRGQPSMSAVLSCASAL